MFGGRHFPNDIILLCVRWYLAYPLSYRNIEEMMLERGIKVDHATINRWVIHYSPQLEQLHRTNKPSTGQSMRMDETYIKVKGAWYYLYRAVDKEGQTIDFLFRKNRDKAAARAFYDKAFGSSGQPDKVTLDKSGSNLAALQDINNEIEKTVEIRQIKYLNNVVEQDHRFIKRITRPMLGFKAFHSAESTLSGIELCHMLKKGQYDNAETIPAFEYFYQLAA